VNAKNEHIVFITAYGRTTNLMSRCVPQPAGRLASRLEGPVIFQYGFVPLKMADDQLGTQTDCHRTADELYNELLPFCQLLSKPFSGTSPVKRVSLNGIDGGVNGETSQAAIATVFPPRA
jgi:hypothetical protein